MRWLALVTIAAIVPSLPQPALGQTLINEGFNDVGMLFAAGGWTRINRSSPIGTGQWQQGANFVFPAHMGPTNACISADFTSGSGVATISNWLLTPTVTLQNGQVLRFYTRTRNPPDLPDRMQVRMSLAGDSADVGFTATSVGVFTTLLLDINPNYTLNGYPSSWTEFSITLSGIPSPTDGRIAFRYFVEQGGPLGVRSDIVGVDTVTLTVGAPNDCQQPLPACAADVAPVANGNGAVDVDDLITVILGWGENGNPTGPRPDGDCAPPPNGDCVVNVDDLIQVILSWGACPPPTGACCLPTGQCAANQSSAQCTAADGVYQGNGSTCGQVRCLQPPPNNDCSDAIPIDDGATEFSTILATTDGNPVAPGQCNDKGATQCAADIWYRYTASCTGTLLVTTCVNLGGAADYDSDIVIYLNVPCTPPDSARIGCNDDDPNNPCGTGPPHASTAFAPVTQGQTYLIRVGGFFDENDVGSGTLNIACLP
jgi:hypothetical protein